MITNSPIAKVSPNLMVISFEVALTHLVFLLLVRGADGWSPKGFGMPSGGYCFAGLTLTAGISKQQDGRGTEEEGYAAAVTGMSTGGTEKNDERGEWGSKEGEGGLFKDKM